jgi:hypothetical protein
MRRLAALALVIAVLGCGSASAPSAGSVASPSRGAVAESPGPAAPTRAPSSSPDRVAGWRSDLDALVPAMEAIHPDLFHDTPKATIERLLDDLGRTADTATDDELMVGLSRAVAMVSAEGRDAHTGLYPWSPDSRYPVSSLPLRLWLFPDGIHVVASLAPYEDLVGVRIVTIAGHPAEEAIRTLDPIIPRDNASTVRLLTPRYLLMPEVLHGVGLLDEVGPVDLEVVDTTGAKRTVAVSPIPMADYNDWAGAYGLFLPADPDVPYLSRMDEPLWWTRLADDETLFVQYNRVEFMYGSLLHDLAVDAAAPGVKRVVVDIRHNFGGEVQTLEAVVNVLATREAERADRLFLITGRNTFSAASLFAAKLQARTHLTIVGEPMGGSPNAWGNPDDITLPWSGLPVGVSTTFELATTADDDRLTIEPDLSVELSFDDWAAKRDASLEAILAQL